MKSIYYVEGEEQTYPTLRDLRYHILGLTDKDRASYNGASVYKKGDYKFVRVIDVKGNNVTFSKE